MMTECLNETLDLKETLMVSMRSDDGYRYHHKRTYFYYDRDLEDLIAELELCPDVSSGKLRTIQFIFKFL